MNQSKKTIQELNLMDDFLMTESMLHAETAEPIARLIIERATGLKVKKLVIECQKNVNGMDTNLHGIRMDVAVNEVNVTEENAETVRVYDIEPNNKQEVHLPRRSRYYQSLEDVKLLETGVDYEKLPELWTIWILPYDPFGENQMIYTVKNVVEGFEKINYNDGVRTLFLYTDGANGGSQELKNLLQYMKHSCAENAVDSELAALHPEVERLKNNREVGVKYMHIKEKIDDIVKEALQEGLEKGLEEGLEKGKREGLKLGLEEGKKQGLELGLEEGKQQGLELGIEEGKKRGLEEGKQQGLELGIEEGKKRGLEEGKKRGLEEGKKRGIEEGKKRGLEEGKQQGLEQGIEVLIEACQDIGLEKKDAQLKIESKFGMSKEQAEVLIAKYWKERA